MVKTTPTYKGNILTEDLQKLPDGTLFYEHVFDGLEPEQVIWKKLRSIPKGKNCLNGDISVEPMTCGQYGEVPGEVCCLGWDNTSEKEWRVVSSDNVMRMVGWLMASTQYLEAE